MATKTLMTAEELLQHTEDGAKKWELYRGELIKVSPSGGRHGQLSVKIGRLVEKFVEAPKLAVVCGAETGFILARNPDTVRAPDVSFVKKTRIPSEGVPDGFWPFAPDLAVEVVSPGDSAQELSEKIKDYLDHGVPLIWVVYPKTKSIAVHTPKTLEELKPESTLDGGEVLPGFRCPVSEFLLKN
jgi:Uma2 family endonuclease